MLDSWKIVWWKSCLMGFAIFLNYKCVSYKAGCYPVICSGLRHAGWDPYSLKEPQLHCFIWSLFCLGWFCSPLSKHNHHKHTGLHKSGCSLLTFLHLPAFSPNVTPKLEEYQCHINSKTNSSLCSCLSLLVSEHNSHVGVRRTAGLNVKHHNKSVAERHALRQPMENIKRGKQNQSREGCHWKTIQLFALFQSFCCLLIVDSNAV